MNIDQIVSESRASQHKEELKALLGILGGFKINTVLEIGVHRGYSLEVWKKMFPKATVIGIDNELSSLDIEATKDCVIINADSHKLRTLTGLSLLLEQVDFLFIDGDHTYNGVKQDFVMYAGLVREGGIIVFHDAVITDNDKVDVYKFWDEIKDEYDHEIIHFEGGTGVGILYL